MVRNRPTKEGAKLGKEVARLIQPEVDKLWKERGIPDLRCQSCAFRAGTVPNGCEQTLMDALKCAAEGEAFLCHQDNDNPCHGWVAARSAMDGKTAEVAWPYSDDPVLSDGGGR